MRRLTFRYADLITGIFRTVSMRHCFGIITTVQIDFVPFGLCFRLDSLRRNHR